MNMEARIGGRIVGLRSDAGWSQGELAEKMRAAGVNWSQGTLSRVELGDRPLRFSEALSVAKVLSVPLDALAGAEVVCPHCNGTPPQGFRCLHCGVAA